MITPECDLVARAPKGRRAAPRLTAVAGRLNPLSGPDTSVADFLIHETAMANVTWSTKDLRTIEYGMVGAKDGYHLIGTLRPLYAQELQRRVLNELGRVGIAVAPAMAVNARAAVVVRGKDEPMRLSLGKPEDASCAVIPKRGGGDRPRIVHRRSFAEETLKALASVAADVHQSAERDLTELLLPGAQIGFLENLCRTGQQDGDTAYGVLGTLSGERTGDKAPWCQIVVEMHDEGEPGAGGPKVRTASSAEGKGLEPAASVAV